MPQVKINAFVDVDVTTVAEAESLATIQAEAMDASNEIRFGSAVVTKMYYVCPKVGKIIVTVSEADRVILKQDSVILSVMNIADYPLERLPSQIVDYKEFIVTKPSTLTEDDINNGAQYIAEQAAAKSMPFKIPVVKVINYNTQGLEKLVLPSMFGAATFLSLSGISSSGDAGAGANIVAPILPIGYTVIQGSLLATGFYDINNSSVEFGSFTPLNHFRGDFKSDLGAYVPASTFVWARVTKPDGSSIAYEGDFVEAEFFSVMYTPGVGFNLVGAANGVWRQQPVFENGDIISIILGDGSSGLSSNPVKVLNWSTEVRSYLSYAALPAMQRAVVSGLSGSDYNGKTPAILFDGLEDEYYYNTNANMMMTVASSFRVWTYVANVSDYHRYDGTLIFMKQDAGGEVRVQNNTKGYRPTPGWYLSSDVMPAGTYRIYGDTDTHHASRLDYEWFVEAVN